MLAHDKKRHKHNIFVVCLATICPVFALAGQKVEGTKTRQRHSLSFCSFRNNSFFRFLFVALRQHFLPFSCSLIFAASSSTFFCICSLSFCIANDRLSLHILRTVVLDNIYVLLHYLLIHDIFLMSCLYTYHFQTQYRILLVALTMLTAVPYVTSATTTTTTTTGLILYFFIYLIPFRKKQKKGQTA